ncbi:MAG: homoserine O-acetyltransferase [Nitriliruptor sp.]|nr:MAG: homoserine O-acetyltransferase [Nitriliruptor sp.]
MDLPSTIGAWRDGDPVGRRRFVDVGTIPLERGGEVPDVRIAYETWGELAPDGRNAILILHALTGDSHVVGEVEPGHPTPGWWPGLIGPGCPIDTDRWFVVAPNVLGGCQGSTGPSSPSPDGTPWASRFPQLTIRDQVLAEQRVTDHLGIDAWAAVIGGSMGAMRVLEWAVMFPDRVRGIAPLAVSATATADQVAIQSIQLLAIRSDPAWQGGDYLLDPDGSAPAQGLGIARRLAHWSYRSEEEFNIRFGRRPQGDEDPLAGGRFEVESYLDHHGTKLVSRFDAASYVLLTQSMNSHDVGRDRGGVVEALRDVRAHVVVAGVDSDRLYPLSEQHKLAHLLRVRGDRATVIRSPHGHDGFLIEVRQVSQIIGDLLERVTAH